MRRAIACLAPQTRRRRPAHLVQSALFNRPARRRAAARPGPAAKKQRSRRGRAPLCHVRLFRTPVFLAHILAKAKPPFIPSHPSWGGLNHTGPAQKNGQALYDGWERPVSGAASASILKKPFRKSASEAAGTAM